MRLSLATYTLFECKVALTCLLSFCAPLTLGATHSTTQVFYASPSNEGKWGFEAEVIRQALEQTKVAYGKFELKLVPVMTHSRAISLMRENVTYPNFFRTFGYEEVLVNHHRLQYIPIPVFRGVLGFRTCFITKENDKHFISADSFAKIAMMSHGQGLGWSDAHILKYNGFVVFEIPEYQSLFPMLSNGRYDLFCRGANEVLDDYKNILTIPNVMYNRTKALYYDFPNFFYTNTQNQRAFRRISLGIRMSVEDGSYGKLWDKYFLNSINFVDMPRRQVFQIENPYLTNLGKEYKRFNHPLLKKVLSPETNHEIKK